MNSNQTSVSESISSLPSHLELLEVINSQYLSYDSGEGQVIFDYHLASPVGVKKYDLSSLSKF